MLLNKVLAQASGRRDVEVLFLVDNRRRSIGLKRKVLIGASNGAYVANIDDDDDIADTYVADICAEIDKGEQPEVIVFNQQSTLEGIPGNPSNPFTVRAGIEYENEDAHIVNGAYVDITRKPWHWCVWRSDLAKAAENPDSYIDEDWYWVRQMIPLVKKQARIDKVLHYYKYDAGLSLANRGKPACT